MEPLERLQQTKRQAYMQPQPVQEQPQQQSGLASVFSQVTRLRNMLPTLRASGKASLNKLAKKIEGFIAPLEGAFKISQRFGNYNPGLYQGVTAGARHQGLDVATPMGTQVRSPVSGRLERGYDPSGFGDYVKVHSPDGTMYQFSHLSNIENLPQTVQAGTVLGKTGGVGARRGRSTGAHLDIGVKRGGKWIDPMSIEPLRRALNG